MSANAVWLGEPAVLEKIVETAAIAAMMIRTGTSRIALPAAAILIADMARSPAFQK